jgi:hypothetical protein
MTEDNGTVVPIENEFSDVVQRRRRLVQSGMIDGLSKLEIAKQLLELHLKGPQPLFTFDGDPDVIAKLSREELLSKRVYPTVRKDVQAIRESLEPEEEVLVEAKWKVVQRLEKHYRIAMDAVDMLRKAAQKPDRSLTSIVRELVPLLREARELASLIAKINGVDTDNKFKADINVRGDAATAQAMALIAIQEERERQEAAQRNHQPN